MSYAPDEIGALVNGIEAALAGNRLNDWQRQFLTGIRQKIARYGTDTRLSEKQVLKLEQIVGPWRKYQGVHLQQPQHQQRQNFGRRTARLAPTVQGFLMWELRRLVYRFVRVFAIAAGVTFVLVMIAVTRPIWSSAPKFFSSPPAAPSQAASSISRGDFEVTDGDTIHLNGAMKGMRLVGFNAPEVFSPQCDSERKLGLQATARLKALVASSNLQLQRVRCSCPPGTEGSEKCNYGRSCGILRADGRDVGQMLISEGLAVPFVCGATSCPPTPRPWCQ